MARKRTPRLDLPRDDVGTPAFLTEPERAMLEAVALQVESLGLPRIGGRIFALMLITPRPLALEEVAALLGVSRASVSINTRLLIMGGIVEAWAVPGDRRRFYRLAEGFYERRLEMARQYLGAMNRITSAALEQVGPDNPSGRARLRAVSTFTQLMRDRLDEVLPALRTALSDTPAGEPSFGLRTSPEPNIPAPPPGASSTPPHRRPRADT